VVGVDALVIRAVYAAALAGGSIRSDREPVD
jgi:hypothetical protein